MNGVSVTVSPPLDVRRLRMDTPACEGVIHLNNAGAALVPAAVSTAIHAHLALEERLGGYEAADAAGDAIAATYRAMEALLGAPEGSVALTSSATESFTLAISSVHWRPGDLLLTTRDDYVSNQIQYLSLARRFGVEVVRAPDAPEGGVDLIALEELIHRRRPRLVSITHVPTSSGLVQPIEAVGALCRARGVPLLIDACQSVGQMPIDVEAIGCDFLSGTARKFLRGPRGAGFLYIAPRLLEAGWEPLFPDLRGADWVAEDLYQPAMDARRFESWEFAWALVLGTGAAAQYALEIGVEPMQARIRALAGLAREELAKLPGVRVLDRGPELCGIVTASFPGWDAAELVRVLRIRGVHTSALDRSSAVFDFDQKGIETALRISPHAYNTEDEILRAVAAMKEVLRS